MVAECLLEDYGIAVEADGPKRFCGRRRTGRSSLRRRLLAARGLEVVSVPHWEWDALRGDERDQEAYLAMALAEAMAGGNAQVDVAAALPPQRKSE